MKKQDVSILKITRLALIAGAGLLLSGLGPGGLRAAGTLTPVESGHAPVAIREHHLKVTIINGFARTEVSQTFFNPNAEALEAVYAFPVPPKAALAEVTAQLGEETLAGEVLAKERAEQLYAQEKEAGNETGLAGKESYQRFKFQVSPVPAKGEARLRFVYYEPLEIDTGVGRYVYPLEEGGTDEVAESFWLQNDKVAGAFTAELEVRSAAPVAEVRMPGLNGAARIEKLGTGHHRATLSAAEGSLDRDIVLYYRLEDGLPGRMEVVPYRADGQRPGTFMAVLTPGVDLKPLSAGADYVFVLDVSGSMSAKVATLAEGVTRMLGKMRPEDRVRVVAFNNRAWELTRGWTPMTPGKAQGLIEEVRGLRTGGGTNLYGGIDLGLSGMDSDRTTSVILVTDAVTNRGMLDPAQFAQLMEQQDVRLFTFVLGNSANWPLVNVLSGASGGFAAGVSNADDIIGKLLQAKEKVLHEALHDVDVSMKGVRTEGQTGNVRGKVFRGEQVVVFGRYLEPGPAEIVMKARISGEERTYRAKLELPAVDRDNPELERLWAMASVRKLERERDLGVLPGDETAEAVEDLGVAYQLVTDETSMLLLRDEDFARLGIERRNRERTQREAAAQQRRAQAPVKRYRVVGGEPAFPQNAPRFGGGGAIGWPAVLLMLGGLAPLAGRLLKRKRG